MAVAVQRPAARKKESVLDKIAKGVNIAESVLGTVSKGAGLAEGIQKMQEANRLRDLEKQDLISARMAREGFQKGTLEPVEVDPESDEIPVDVYGVEGTDAYVRARPAAQAKGLTPLQVLAEQRAQRSEARAGRKEKREVQKIETQKKERKESLDVPGLGEAKTPEEAKKLREGLVQKAKFDRLIDEMITMRKKYGAEQVNTEAIARGKQISKDLLLTYKNLAKLGVLSQADEAIINAIIPKDPLEFKASQLIGMDPILAQLEGFKKDSDADYVNKVSLMIRGGKGLSAPKDAKTFNVGGKDYPVGSVITLKGKGPHKLGPDGKLRPVKK